MEETGDVGHDTTLIWAAYVAQVSNFKKLLQCDETQRMTPNVGTYRDTEMFFGNLEC